MTRPLPAPRRAVRAKDLGRFGVLGLFAVLIVFGRFDRFPEYGVLQYSLLAVLVVVVLLELLELAEPEAEGKRNYLWLGLWLMTAARIAVQATGGPDSYLSPISYLLFAVLASVTGALPAALIWLFSAGLEAGGMAVSGQGTWEKAAVYAFTLAAFGAGVGGFIALERRGRFRAEEVLSGLERDLAEFKRDDTVHRLSGLSEKGREKQALRSVLALDKALAAALETGRELLAAQTVALYWRPGPDSGLYLREIASRREGINPNQELRPGEGLLGRCVEQARPLRLSGRKRVENNLPYSSPGSDHLMALPVMDGERVQGLLVADREGEPGFAESDEKLLLSLALLVREVHAHALLLKRAEAEASQFRSLAELADRLSRTLALEEILEAVIRTGQALTGCDAAAVLMSENGSLPAIVRSGGSLSERAVGQAVPVEGTLAGWSMTESQYLSIPDLADRSRKTPVLAEGLDPAGMRSVLIHPLPLRRGSQGAVVFFAARAEAFSRRVVQASGILADLAAVSIHNASLYREMEQKAVTDGLTGLHNHRWFQERLAEELERAGRLGTRLAVVLADIDHFKRINDSFGHPAGDEVLKAVAGILRDSIRKVDCAARYGGEEFVLILLGTGREGAGELTERIRTRVSKLLFPAGDKEFRVTLSAGIAVYPEHAAGKDDLIAAADQALYRAKQTGRNRIVSAGSSSARLASAGDQASGRSARVRTRR